MVFGQESAVKAALDARDGESRSLNSNVAMTDMAPSAPVVMPGVVFEGVGFGFPVSGLDIYPLLRIDVTGPVLWTGGAFGPEAGLIVLPSLIVGGILIYLYTKNRDSNNETSRRVS